MASEEPAETDRDIEELQSRLADLQDERDRLEKKLDADSPLKPYQIELLKLQRHLEEHKIPMIAIFEGRDASGKGGTIRRITRFMNEKRYSVVALGKPTDEQRSQWYFQRYVQHFPSGGEMVLFDRSWYNRSMVEPVFGFCTMKEYRDFLRGVVGLEKDLVRNGTVLVKLYFSVDKATQAQRFDRRRTDPLRQWKLSPIDEAGIELYDEYTAARNDMLRTSSTDHAPWTVVNSNDKRRARLGSIRALLHRLDYHHKDHDTVGSPDPHVVQPADALHIAD